MTKPDGLSASPSLAKRKREWGAPPTVGVPTVEPASAASQDGGRLPPCASPSLRPHLQPHPSRTAPCSTAVARSLTTSEAKAALAAAAEAEAAKSIKGSTIAKVAFACVLAPCLACFCLVA